MTIPIYYFLILITLAGTPPTIAKSGTFRLTTAPAAITAPEPIFTPGNMITRVPIQTSSPITTVRSSFPVPPPCSRIGMSVRDISWVEVRIITSGPIMTSDPICNGPRIFARIPIPDRSPIEIPRPVPKFAPCSILICFPHWSNRKCPTHDRVFLNKENIQ